MGLWAVVGKRKILLEQMLALFQKCDGKLGIPLLMGWDGRNSG